MSGFVADFATPAPQPSLSQYGMHAASAGTLTFELLDQAGTTIAAGTVAYGSTSTNRVMALIATVASAASVAAAVGAVVSPSTLVRFNTGYHSDGTAVTTPTATTLSTWAAASVNLIGWTF